MRSICFILYDLTIVGGVEKVVEGLANQLTDTYKVYLVSLHGDQVNPSLHFDPSIEVKFLNLPTGRLRTQMTSAIRPLRKFFRKNHIKVAFSEATFCGFITAPLRFLSRTKVVFCDHGALANQLDDADITKMRKLATKCSNKVVVLTKRSEDDYKKIFNTKAKKLTYIYNWVDESLIDENRTYPVDSTTIVTAGRFTKEKGFDMMVQVASLVLPTHPDWHWDVYGEGPMLQEISEMVEKNGIGQQLRLKGFCSDMRAVYQNAAMYVLPSYREGVPLVLLEAKAYKIPCVSFDIVSGPREILEDGVNGILVKPYEIEEMATRISVLMDHPEMRQNLSEHAYTNLEQFRQSTIKQQWVILIEDLS